jgi:hypothetical protein
MSAIALADGGARIGSRFADPRLDQGGLGARVPADVMRHRFGLIGHLVCGVRDVAAAQCDQTEDASRGRGTPVRPEGLSGFQCPLRVGVGVGEPAIDQVDARAQDRQRRLGGDAVHRLAAGGVQDLLGLAELAQIDKGGGQHQQRLYMTSIAGEPGAMARGVAHQPERVADLSLVPAGHRASD